MYLLAGYPHQYDIVQNLKSIIAKSKIMVRFVKLNLF